MTVIYQLITCSSRLHNGYSDYRKTYFNHIHPGERKTVLKILGSFSRLAYSLLKRFIN